MSSAVVLSSGGINSATVLEIALRAHRPETIHMLSFKYESKSNDQECLASLDLYHYYLDRDENVTWTQIELSSNGIAFLGGILLSRATAHAITKGAGYIYTDISENSATEFLGSMAAAIYIASHRNVRLKFPLIWMTGADIIKRALNLEVPANLTWSCSRPVDQVHCGMCQACIDRIYAFVKLGIIDPMTYAVELDWNTDMTWPHMGEKQLRAGQL